VSGKEYWLLYTNDLWAEAGGEDCQVVWDAIGSVEEPQGTGSYSLALTLSINLTETNCEETLYAGSESFGVTYDVQEESGGGATFFFSSGSELGQGNYNASNATYITEKNCLLF
jgi:hypothetical protein